GHQRIGEAVRLGLRLGVGDAAGTQDRELRVGRATRPVIEEILKPHDAGKHTRLTLSLWARPLRVSFPGRMDIVGTRTLASALEDQARRFADRAFLVAEDGARWTWRDFDRDVNRAAHFLIARGLKPGETFNLHLGNCPEFLVFWMAAAKTGAVMVPTNPASTAEEMAYILEH